MANNLILFLLKYINRNKVMIRLLNKFQLSKLNKIRFNIKLLY